MTDRTRAFWILGPGRAEVRDEQLATPGVGEVLVHAQFSAVSRGTESLVFNGRVPPSEYERMRCPFQTGNFPGPLKYGYANVGVVHVGPAELVNRPVFCLFPHQAAYVVPAHAVVPVPENVPAERAVLAANLETAVNAIWDAAPRLGDRVTVVGGGVLGCLCAYLLSRHVGVEVELVDVNAERAVVAEKFGVAFALPESATPERDLVLHTSASEAGVRRAFELAAPGATVLELSWFGDVEPRLPLGRAFHQRRLTLRSSQVGTLSPRARARFDFRARLGLALKLCADPALDALFDGQSSFESLPRTMPRLCAPGTSVLCHRIVYEPAPSAVLSG